MKITAKTGRRADVMSVPLRAVVGDRDILVRIRIRLLSSGTLIARKKNFQYFFLLTYPQAHKSSVLKGAGARSGSVPLTNGSGFGSRSWRPKNMRIRIPNTGFYGKSDPFKRKRAKERGTRHETEIGRERW